MCLGHHELPPVAHTTMLREFPGSLQHSTEAVIPPRPSASSASDYHQLYVSHCCKIHLWHPGNSQNLKNDAKAKTPFLVQLQKNAGRRSDANANTGVVNDQTSGQDQHRGTAVLPTYMTQDRLTLAVLTLLLGGWLAIALSFPIVCCALFFS